MSNSTEPRSKTKKIIYKLCAAAFWISVWEAIALWAGNDIIICSPLAALKRLCELVTKPDFRSAAAFSSARILLGFFSALFAGIALAAVSGRFSAVRILLQPITSVIKATPVASFIILALIWFGSRNLSAFISFLMVFPVIYLNVLAGIDSTDPKLNEMAKIFRFGPKKTLLYVYFPQVLPFLRSGCSAALGLCWKSGIAAEVIGIPSGSVGEKLYRAKLYLETGDLLAWTAVIIAVSVIFEKLFMLVLKAVCRRLEAVGK